MRELATEMGVPETYSTTRVGVFFGEPGETVADPYFGGEGPPRAGCFRCGACMVGCRHNAMQTEEDPDKPNPRFIDLADRVTRRAAEKLDATPQSGLTEAQLNIPTTAHIMGGAVIGERPETGVVDGHQRAFGCGNLLVCDGSAIPANIGVNPSLTITAMTEHAMSHISAREPRAAAADTDMDVAHR